jgi:hypothetical protein
MAIQLDPARAAQRRRRGGWSRLNAALRAGMALAAIACALLFGSERASARFFDQCAAPGDQTITVTQNITVRNERITLIANDTQEVCEIDVNPGVTLTLINVVINVTNEKRINFDGGDTSKLSIQSSSIIACDSDIVGFAQVRINRSRLVDPSNSTSCDVKEIEPTGDISITESFLKTEGPETDNDIVVQSSSGRVTLFGNSLNSIDNIRVTSLAGPVMVSLNKFVSQNTSGNVDNGIAINGASSVKVLGNVLHSVGGAVVIQGSPCLAKVNVPSVSCQAGGADNSGADGT